MLPNSCINESGYAEGVTQENNKDSLVNFPGHSFCLHVKKNPAMFIIHQRINHSDTLRRECL